MRQVALVVVTPSFQSLASAQQWSVPFSLISLTLSSAKLFFSQRLGRYSDFDPPLKNLAFVFPLILVQGRVL